MLNYTRVVPKMNYFSYTLFWYENINACVQITLRSLVAAVASLVSTVMSLNVKKSMYVFVFQILRALSVCSSHKSNLTR